MLMILARLHLKIPLNMTMKINWNKRKKKSNMKREIKMSVLTIEKRKRG